jgi:AAA+ superfamily predicted ATPase
LDPALFRRFDDIIEYSMPTADEALLLVKRRLLEEPHAKINWSKAQAALAGMSYAEVVRIADEAVKERIIESLPKITTALILKMAGERRKRPGRTG